MKPIGANFVFHNERLADIIRVYKRYINNTDIIVASEMWNHIASSPAKRFWIDTSRASIIVAHLEKGGDLKNMSQHKQAMYNEIFERYSNLRKQHPTASRRQLVSDVICQPAPSFYISPSSARQYLALAKKTLL